MELSSAFDYVGASLVAVGALFILIQAFEKSTGWGMAMLIFGGLLWPVHVIRYWKDASFWFFVALTGFLIAYIL